ncbi:MAG: plastocyanin/azurin family copper-binding protein, partial [Phycisphaeraceae bacterium]
RYDVTEFTVTPGQRVKLTFENPDFMPHNLIIVKPGTADAVAMLAIEMGAEGFAKGFVPESTDILQSTRMLNANQSQTLEFTAPTEAGEYPFVCTFPGHATLMRGVMKVAN